MRLWPFETPDELPEEAQIIACEVYPSIVPADAKPGETKDLAQVRALASHFAELDQAGRLAGLFSPKSVDNPEYRAKVVSEEGWIFGIS